MVEALKDYNRENKLGYTGDQLNELAFNGTQNTSKGDSGQFKGYIQGLENKNNTTYDEELKGFNNRISSMIWKLDKKEEKASSMPNSTQN